jgi:hypothetical protein
MVKDYYMARKNDRYDHDDAEDDDIVDKREVSRLADDAFKKSSNAMSQAELGKTTKILGMFEVDAGLAAYFDSIYNVGANYATKSLAPKIDSITRALGEKAGMVKDGAALNRTAAVTTFGVAAALKSGKFISPIFKAFSDERKEKKQMVHDLAPVLDDIKGKHSIGILNAVMATDNEVIYAHRKRLARIAQVKKFGSVVDLGINAGTNLLFDVKRLTGMWKGDTLKDINTRIAQDKAAEKAKEEAGEGVGELKGMVGNLANISTGPIADRVKRSNERKLELTLQPYSAYEMIRELDAQVTSNPKAKSFVLPKTFQNPKKRQEECQLEQYVMQIFIQHQKDMSDISPDHTEIREALKEDLVAIAKPIAHAIRNGDMNVLSLVRLVGEGKVIKNHGRAIISAHEVELLIKQDAPKHENQVHGDPNEYYKDKAFTRDDFKTALKALEGDRKNLLVAIAPDEVLREAGMEADEIKERREAIKTVKQRLLADAVMGITSQPEETLKKTLASSELRQFNEAAEAISHKGEAAVGSSGTTLQANGIEQKIANWAVPTILGDKAHFGTVLAKGHEKFAAMQDGDDEGDERKRPDIMKHHTKEYAERAEGGHKTHSERHAARHAKGSESYIE